MDTCLYYSTIPYTYSWENLLTGQVYQDSLSLHLPSGVYLFSLLFSYQGLYPLNEYNQDIAIINDDIGFEYSYQQIKEGPGFPLDGKLYIVGEYDSIAWYNMNGELVSTNDTLVGLNGYPYEFLDYLHCEDNMILSLSNI